MSPAQLAQLERQLAERAAEADIRSGSVVAVVSTEATWRDVRPMLDSREHPPHEVDMAAATLAYALERGLIAYCPYDRNLVRLLRRD